MLDLRKSDDVFVLVLDFKKSYLRYSCTHCSEQIGGQHMLNAPRKGGLDSFRSLWTMYFSPALRLYIAVGCKQNWKKYLPYVLISIVSMDTPVFWLALWWHELSRPLVCPSIHQNELTSQRIIKCWIYISFYKMGGGGVCNERLSNKFRLIFGRKDFRCCNRLKFLTSKM